MKENKDRTKMFLTLDNELATFLKSQDNHRYSRYDAFVWLIEHIQEADLHALPSSAYREFLVTYTDLAKTWRWSRPTVQKFIEGLEAQSVIVKRKHVNAFALSLPDDAVSKVAGSSTCHHPPHSESDACIGSVASPHDEPAPANRGKHKSNRGKECVKNAKPNKR